MSERRLLIDNDAFVLLAGAGYLQQSVETLGFDYADARRLASLEPMLRKPAKAFAKHPAEIRLRAMEECRRVAVVAEVPSTDMAVQLGDVTGLDAGEALLFGVAASRSLHFLASNDKRAMREVATHPGLALIRAAVAGRVVCIETIVKLLIDQEGASEVAKRFGLLGDLDKRLGVIFSPAALGHPEQCLEAVESFLNGLQQTFGADFLFNP